MLRNYEFTPDYFSDVHSGMLVAAKRASHERGHADLLPGMAVMFEDGRGYIGDLQPANIEMAKASGMSGPDQWAASVVACSMEFNGQVRMAASFAEGLAAPTDGMSTNDLRTDFATNPDTKVMRVLASFWVWMTPYGVGRCAIASRYRLDDNNQLVFEMDPDKDEVYITYLVSQDALRNHELYDISLAVMDKVGVKP